MNKPRTIEGRWWIHGDDKAPHFGVLTFDPGKGLNLSVKIPRSSTLEDILFSSAKQQPTLPTVIHGIDQNDRPVTLFGCPFPRTGMSQGLERYDIQSMAALLGLHSLSWHDAKFVSGGAEFSLFHDWMGRDQVKHVTSTDGKPAIAFEAPPKILFQLTLGVRVEIESTFEGTIDVDRLEYRFGHRIWFHFDEPHSIREIRDSYVGVFRRLLCLLTGSHVFMDSFQLTNGDRSESGERPTTECELLQDCIGISDTRRAKRDKHLMAVFYPEIAGQFEDVVRRWFECDQCFAPVLDLYLNVKANPMASQTRFLLLAQALEAFHSRSSEFTATELPKERHKERLEAVIKTVPTELQGWVKDRLASSNQKTLAMRIDDLLKSNAREIAKLAAAIPDFAERVRHTRNYYTHYSDELLRSGKVAQGTDLIRLSYILQDLLEICLLKEIGIQGNPIERILSFAATRQYYTLDEDQSPDSSGVPNGAVAGTQPSDEGQALNSRFCR